jgi:hypothetical protein
MGPESHSKSKFPARSSRWHVLWTSRGVEAVQPARTAYQ